MESIYSDIVILCISGAPLGCEFGSEKDPEPKREGKHGIDMFLILPSYAFLAYQVHLSDPIFGSEIDPEPKR